ncbi:MAG: PriCT-2 domain-containing protein [Proteobacteria bacterium]|nr:PriCT-2 domain-containing protein [Pseudomonadota bacterium]
MLESVRHLVDQGFAVHLLRERSKAPFKDDWSTLPVATFDDLSRAYRRGQNVGVRLGEPSKVAGLFLHVLDLDIRQVHLTDEARDALDAVLPGWRNFPLVRSGSGGDSRHVYFLTDRPFRSKKLAHSAEKFVDPEGKRHWAWEIELFGTGKQVVLPPSIHPDTGNPYAWEREFDFDLVEMGCGPVVSAGTVEEWGVTADRGRDEEDDDLSALVRKKPMGLSPEEIDDILADLPFDAWCEDREGWLQVGMALHHEFEGRPEGLKVWDDFSKRSPKFDAADQERVWASFAGKPNPLRMATLVKAAALARLENDHAGEGFEDGDDDLLGDVPSCAIGGVDEIEAIGNGASDPNLNWRSRLDLTEQGAIKPTLANLELIIRHDPRTRGLARLNLFTGEVVQRGEPGRLEVRRPSPKGVRQLAGPMWSILDPINGDLWTDEKDNAIRAMLETAVRQGGYGLKVTDRDLSAATDLVAREQQFHPVREWLETLEWDRVPRLESLFVRFLGARDTAYIRSVARLTLVGAVARVFEPGHKFDFAPILEGLQGKRKSTFISILARHWFAELEGDFHDPRQMIELMHGALILEIPELSGFSRSDVRQIKAFISRTHDKARLAYARRASVFPRQCIFIGSTNDDEYLRDDTGGRRFWPVRCEVDEIDTARLSAEVDQLWAEAVHVYRGMREVQRTGTLPLYLTDEKAREEALQVQEDRRVETAEDALAGQISRWLDLPLVGFDDPDEDDLVGGGHLRAETCLLEIWVDCLGRDRSAYRATDAQLLGRAMGKVDGWIKRTPRVTEKFGNQRIYIRA